eukprot:m.384991 g.384991  ORF g.384991 m.384991 type:complete len:52 (+) comp21001_c0_seq17:752-907(+)
MNYGTTWHGLKDIAKLKSNETLLVLGASGGVGGSTDRPCIVLNVIPEQLMT